MFGQIIESDNFEVNDNFQVVDDEALASITGGCNPDPDAKICRPDL